ncbi:hypothetical protein C1645_221051 [Glomus cerebriforme]|uniref:Uncharacterized protein n=1 Tax=Glomus cerebriforme TaxID=658196 RepID=A0A397TLS8_9GLOM|nr:hypothetical protein C1645_221051 [Glomus cerebriforme]
MFGKSEQGANTLGMCGSLINWNNEIKSRVIFGQTCTNNVIVIQDLLDNGGGEFLYTCYSFDQKLLDWTRYTIDSNNGTINKQDDGTIINVNQFSQSLKNWNIFPTEGGGYGIVTYNQDSLNQVTLFLYFISSISSPLNSKFKGPFQLYKPTQLINSLIIFKCGVSFVEFGYNCLIYFNNDIFVNVDFLDSGSILSSNEFRIIDQTDPTDVIPNNIINVGSLYYGGYVILIQTPTNVIGLTYSNNGILFQNVGGSDWQMPLTLNGFNLIYTGKFGVFTNNTIWSIANSPQGINLITNDLLTNYSANVNDAESRNNLLAFGNSFIGSVNPPIGSTIDTNPVVILVKIF